MANIILSNPQIVNGCQTVNSIYEVLKDNERISGKDYKKEFTGVYVFVKILVKDKSFPSNFYDNVVEYTNKQNKKGGRPCVVLSPSCFALFCNFTAFIAKNVKKALNFVSN